MSFEEDLAAKVRAALTEAGVIREVKMFGGVGFMLNGNLVAAASKRGLLLRVGKDQQPNALTQPGTRSMVMRGRVMEGYIYIDPPAINATAVRKSLGLAIKFVRSLPVNALRSRRK